MCVYDHLKWGPVEGNTSNMQSHVHTHTLKHAINSGWRHWVNTRQIQSGHFASHYNEWVQGACSTWQFVRYSMCFCNYFPCTMCTTLLLIRLLAHLWLSTKDYFLLFSMAWQLRRTHLCCFLYPIYSYLATLGGQAQMRTDGSRDFYSHSCNLSVLAHSHFLHPAAAPLIVNGFPMLLKVMKYPHN